MDNATVGFVLLGAVIFCLVILNIMNRWRNYFNAGRFSLRYLGEGLKIKPLPKATKIRHIHHIQISVVSDLGDPPEWKELRDMIYKLSEDIESVYGMTDVHFTGGSSAPMF